MTTYVGLELPCCTGTFHRSLCLVTSMNRSALARRRAQIWAVGPPACGSSDAFALCTQIHCGKLRWGKTTRKQKKLKTPVQLDWWFVLLTQMSNYLYIFSLIVQPLTSPELRQKLIVSLLRHWLWYPEENLRLKAELYRIPKNSS